MKKLLVLASFLALAACNASGGSSDGSGESSSSSGGGDVLRVDVTGSGAAATGNGRANGTNDASEMHTDCVGGVPSDPHGVLNVTARAQVTVAANNADGDDLTLVIAGPNNTYFCDDDTNGLQPEVVEVLEPGEYRVFVGSYDAEASPTFELSVTQAAAPAPAGTGAGAPAGTGMGAPAGTGMGAPAGTGTGAPTGGTGAGAPTSAPTTP